MAINFNNQNRGIETLDLSEYGLLQPQNQNITDYGEDITTTNNPTTMTEMLGRYPGMDRIQELQNF